MCESMSMSVVHRPAQQQLPGLQNKASHGYAKEFSTAKSLLPALGGTAGVLCHKKRLPQQSHHKGGRVGRGPWSSRVGCAARGGDADLGAGAKEASVKEVEVTSLRDNFSAMCFWLSVNHGVVTTPVGVASSLLGPEVASTGNGVLYVCSVLSSLVLAAPATASLGPRGALIVAMLCYSFYTFCFAIACAQPSGDDVQWLSFLLGSTCAGFGAGLLWTGQGVYFNTTAAEVAAAEELPKDNITAGLASSFAFIYLGLEVGSKLGFSLLQFAELDPQNIAAFYALVGTGSVAMISGVRDLRPPSAANVDPLSKLSSAISLWSDPKLWLLAPCNLLFGFSAAYMNGYINGSFAAVELGKSSVAFLGAVTALVAAILAKTVFEPLADSSAGKGSALFVGSVSLFLIPASVVLSGGCNGWGYGLLVLYLLQGSGRAVYESTNKAVFSDFFPDEKAEGAFANCFLQSSLAFAACFFLQASTSPYTLGSIVALLAFLTPIGYGVASSLRDTPPSNQDESGIGGKQG